MKESPEKREFLVCSWQYQKVEELKFPKCKPFVKDYKQKIIFASCNFHIHASSVRQILISYVQ